MYDVRRILRDQAGQEINKILEWEREINADGGHQRQ